MVDLESIHHDVVSNNFVICFSCFFTDPVVQGTAGTEALFNDGGENREAIGGFDARESKNH